MKMYTGLIALAAALALPGVASAEKVCVPQGFGVPGNNGVPTWDATSGPIDDGRWHGSSGHTVNVGTPTAPVSFRALYTGEGTDRRAVWQWRINAAVPDSGISTPGNFFLALKEGPQTWLIRFRVNRSATAPTEGIFTRCDASDTSCQTTHTSWYSVLRQTSICDTGTGGTCDCDFANPATTVSQARHFDADTSLNPTWLQDAKYWKLPGGQWAVGVRPLVQKAAGIPADLSKITDATQIWYEAPLQINFPTGGTNDELVAPHHQWPFNDPYGLCRPLGGNAFEMAVTAAAPLMVFGDVDYIDGTETFASVGCAGVSLEGIGVIGPTGTKGWTITGQYDADGPGGNAPVDHNNVFEVQVRNTGAALPANSIRARFRLADWGAQANGNPIYETAVWNPVPRIVDGTAGTCDPTAPPVAFGCGLTTPSPAIPTTTTTPVTLQLKTAAGAGWTLLPAERKSYGIGLPTDPGVQTKAAHQCVLVDLEGQGDINFLRRSLYTNMQVANLSTARRTAVLDGTPANANRDVFLVVMSKNLPTQVPEGTLGQELVQEAAWNLADELENIYPPVIIGVRGEAPAAVAAKAARGPVANALPPNLVLDYDEARRIIRVLRRFANLGNCEGSGCDRTPDWDAEFERLLREVPDTLASEIAPAMEIYAYVQGRSSFTNGQRRTAVLEPMTSFGLNLFHDGGLQGYINLINGAQQIAPNVYRVRLGPDGLASVEVAAQAVEPAEQPIRQDPNWRPDWEPVREGDDGNDGCGDWCPPTRGGFVGFGLLWLVTIAGVRRMLRRRKSA